MIGARALPVVLGLCMGGWNLFAQQLDDSFYSLLERVLDINIAATISETGEKAVWNVESSEVTVPGRSVSVKLVGTNVIIVAQLTPYINPDGTILLVAQGQVWLSTPHENQIKYLSTLQSLPVRLGETVVFFPLGVNVEREADNLYNIVLEISVQQRQANTKR